MNITDYCISVSKSLISIDRELKVGDSITVTIEGEVYSDKTIPDHDGNGYVKVFVIKGAIADVKAEGVIISEEQP